MLRVYEGDKRHEVVHLNDRFRHDTPDEEWLQGLAGDDPGWVVISGDGRIVKNRVQMSVLAQVNLTCFLMAQGWMNKPIEETAWQLVKAWPDILLRARVQVPTIFEVRLGKGLKIEEKGPTRQWRADPTA